MHILPCPFINYVTGTGGGDLLSEYRREAVIRYIEDRIFIFLLVTLIFITGIIGGAVAVNGLQEGAETGVNPIPSSVFSEGLGESQPAVELAPAGKISVLSQSENPFLFFLFGFSVIGTPAIPFLFSLKGFHLGFTAGFILGNNVGGGGVSLCGIASPPPTIS